MSAVAQDAVQRSDALHESLLRDYIAENLMQFESLAISAREALWRDNLSLTSIHIDQLRLVGREIVRSFQELQEIGGAL